MLYCIELRLSDSTYYVCRAIINLSVLTAQATGHALAFAYAYEALNTGDSYSRSSCLAVIVGPGARVGWLLDTSIRNLMAA